MARKYLAFLGTSSYILCNYNVQGEYVTSPFVQVALTKQLCKDWTPQDRILVFTTEKAKRENWTALKTELEQTGPQCPVKSIDIPEGRSEEKLWEIFDVILQTLKPGDQIIFDMTHAFRSLPMLTLIILNYAKFVKKCTLFGIYYGAMEALGFRSEVEKMPIEVRNVPVFDLTPFVSLLDWTVGIDRFLTTGDAKSIEALTEENIHQVLRKTRGKHKEEAEHLKQMIRALSRFTQNSSTCRGKELSKSALEVQTYSELSVQYSDELIKPLAPLLEEIHTRFQAFRPQQELTNIFQIARWCHEHNLIQQGITILMESIVTDLCVKLELDPDATGDRLKITKHMVQLAKQESSEESAQNSGRKSPLLQKIRQFLPSQEFINRYDALRQIRNDIDHAGHAKQYKSAPNFERDFDKLLEFFQQEIPLLAQNI